jgi:hypothetical protein
MELVCGIVIIVMLIISIINYKNPKCWGAFTFIVLLSMVTLNAVYKLPASYKTETFITNTISVQVGGKSYHNVVSKTPITIAVTSYSFPWSIRAGHEVLAIGNCGE